MRPTLRQMEYIVTVHQLGGFGLAAEKLNVSQPSLSNQVAAVEADLGVRLFERGRAGARATARGEDFVMRARRILSEFEALRGRMLSDLPFGGRLRLGVLPSIGPYLLPQAMMALHETEPDLRVIVREESTLFLDEGLRSGRFDAIISTPEDHPNTFQHPLFMEPLWVAVAQDHPLAERPQVMAADLAGPADAHRLWDRRGERRHGFGRLRGHKPRLDRAYGGDRRRDWYPAGPLRAAAGHPSQRSPGDAACHAGCRPPDRPAGADGSFRDFL